MFKGVKEWAEEKKSRRFDPSGEEEKKIELFCVVCKGIKKNVGIGDES